jgi:Membrane proteins related to metalloendopeptidases
MDVAALDRTVYPPSPPPSTPPLFFPVTGYKTGRGYGVQRNAFDPSKYVWHGAVDIGAPLGTPVYAIADGKVFDTKQSGSCGLRAQIAHSDPGVPFSFSAAYCHLSRVAVSNGQHVKKGELIGYVGATGTATGPHLHLAIWHKYDPKTGIQAFDPVPWIGTMGGLFDQRELGGAVPFDSAMMHTPLALARVNVGKRYEIGYDALAGETLFVSPVIETVACYA